ncbi:MAG: imidazole glycerol phosphate synthase subunit HisH [Planctomycetota bacterium]|nr:imidazole glycerol phosphate synthase subunit HisH [Planctomycetota bacterium]
MNAPEVIVVRTGVANIASVTAALTRLGAAPVLSDDPDEVQSAERVLLPGVGAFAAAMARLRKRDLDRALTRRIESDRPTLAICLGMQLLCAASEESPDERGLSIIDQVVTRFPRGARVPHFGWNTVSPDPRARLITPGCAYFANSYRLLIPPDGWTVATTDHAGEFISAIERGPVLACQFHPELSGDWGLDLMRRWLECSAVEAAPC